MKRLAWAAGALAAVGLGVATMQWDVREVQAQSGHTVTFEAEGAQVVEAPFRKRNARLTDRQPRPQSNGGTGYVEIPNRANGSAAEERGGLPGVARFRVNIPADGQYYLWARVYWPDGCGNSFFVRKSGRPTVVLGEDGTYNAWHWVRLANATRLPLTRGVNTIEFLNREDGVVFDQVQLTTTSRVPTGAQRATQGALAQ